MLRDVMSPALLVHQDPDLGESTLGDLFAVRAHNQPELVVIGDTGIDLFVAVGGMPERDSKAIGKHLGIFGGGMAANLATAAKSAFPGLRVRLVSRIGGDEWGAMALSQLVSLGVDTAAVAVDPRSATWWCAVGLDSSGEKALMGGRTAASLPTPDDFQPTKWAEACWLHVLGDTSWSLEGVEEARGRGTITSVDIEGSFVADNADRARQLALLADLPILNLSAIRGLGSSGQEISDVIDGLTGGADGPKEAKAMLVTLGSQGALFVHRSPGSRWRYFRHDAVRLPVVDSTGAGDAFAGTLIASLLSGTSVRDSMKNATTAAGRTIGRLGSRGPRLDDYQERTNS